MNFTYEASARLRGDATAALDIAEDVLEWHGLDVRREGFVLHATRPSPRRRLFGHANVNALGSRDVEVAARGSTLSIRAELHAARELIRVAMVVPPLVSVVMVGTLIGLKYALHGRPPRDWLLLVVAASLAVVVGWILLGGMGLWTRRATVCQLDSLLHNMNAAQLDRSGGPAGT